MKTLETAISGLCNIEVYNVKVMKTVETAPSDQYNTVQMLPLPLHGFKRMRVQMGTPSRSQGHFSEPP